MATLINYDVSTFRDAINPNKRRLQDLQHSEARAHAARVAYWRKRKIEVPIRIRKHLPHGTSGEGQDPITSSTVLPQTRPLSDDEDAGPLALKRSKRVIERRREPLFLDQSRSELRPRSQSRLSGTTSQTNATSSNGRRNSASHDGWVLANVDVDGRVGLARYLRLSRAPSSDIFDPLDSFPVRQGDEVVTAIDHYITNWAPSQRPGLKYQTRDNPLIRDMFPSALQNVELFEAIVALCLTFKAAGQNTQTRLSAAALHHKVQALAGIRAKLVSGTVDEAVIMATIFLMITDNVFLDVQAYQAHLAGLQKMVKAGLSTNGGVYGDCLRSFISWAECNALLIFGEGTARRDATLDSLRLQYPTKPFSISVLKTINALPPGFRTIAMDGQLSAQVLGVLGDTVHWTSCIDHLYGQTSSDEKQAFLIGFDPRANSAKLMRLCRHSGRSRTVESTICKVLFIYHANLLNWTCRCSGYRRLVGELTEAVRLCDTQETWSRSFWSWAALITANAARRGGQEQCQFDVMAKFMT
ncbi:hypothetical protein A1O3_08819 [Capronia epimyces CBS 606.96]|uniref:Tachykinin family protein n=1 Tax=Capronia epimyces CBS 606.96 TaxID=1182542 RepID=W9XFN6_9EURO|nr:uncharacterized protein A1O3_08819 [Capronia epimyces CBS 606.96]EXJ79317.1 hypothetical protein A1O3_08819 [Capronia epimyces CBS 606.96]